MEGGDAGPIEPLVGDQALEHVPLAVRRREDDAHAMTGDADLRPQEIRDICRRSRPHLRPRREATDGERVFLGLAHPIRS